LFQQALINEGFKDENLALHGREEVSVSAEVGERVKPATRKVRWDGMERDEIEEENCDEAKEEVNQALLH